MNNLVADNSLEMTTDILKKPVTARLARSTLSVPIVVEGTGLTGSCQPITLGLPFAQGTLRDPVTFQACVGRGKCLTVQSRVLARWSDGSVKWLLADTLLPSDAPWSGTWSVAQLHESDSGPSAEVLSASQTARSIVVETGAATFHIGRESHPLLRAVVGGKDELEPDSFRIVLTDARGREATPRIETVALEAAGPVRCTVRIDGRFEGRAPLRFTARLCFFAGTGFVRVRLALHNPNRARHRGGLWDLGDPGSIFFRDFSLELSLSGAGGFPMTWVPEHAQSPRLGEGGELEIYQDSSGGENWKSRNHVNRLGQVPCKFRGYRVRQGDSEELGLRASPVVSLSGPNGSVSAAIPEFWQQFPKALEVSDRALRCRLFPRQFGDLFELQGGEKKTHTLWLDFSPADGHSSLPLRWVHEPARVHATPEWYASTGVIPNLSPAHASECDRIDTALQHVVAGKKSFSARREVIDEFGWRHFGEVYADHETAHYRGELPIISHYNNQYDMILGQVFQYYRTGDVRWFELLDPLARHVSDIDIYHTDRDKSAYNGGLFWHTDHYRSAATCTHRGYSKANRGSRGRSYGGGPSGEHNYTTGLLHYYYLTGDEDARESVISLADWVINMDDGAKTVFGLIDDGPTGLASRTAEPSYHGPGRGGGNSVNALLDGWLLAGRREYLEKAELLIRRCVHPADDIQALGLLNPEPRWSYTVFLSTLARYLLVKAEAGELDAMYSYAQTCLVTYALWMLRNEVPYFDHPEKLEFPLETWGAQELRKANVFRLAAAHVDEPLRNQLIARGDELAERAWSDVMRFESWYVARSLAILMLEGTYDAYFQTHSITIFPSPPGKFDFGAQVAFVAQKERIYSQLKTLPGIVRVTAQLLLGIFDRVF